MVNKCQYWSSKEPKCSNNGNVMVIYDCGVIGRICREHVKPYQDAYPQATFRFEDKKRRLIHADALDALAGL